MAIMSYRYGKFSILIVIVFTLFIIYWTRYCCVEKTRSQWTTVLANYSRTHNPKVSLSSKSYPRLPEAEQNVSIPCGDTYTLFRDMNFFDDQIRNRLCKNSYAYSLRKGVFPPCSLSERFNFDEDLKFPKANLSIQLTSRSVEMFTYSKLDLYVSRRIMESGSFEPYLVKAFFQVVKSIPDVTLLDIGSNIGVYSLHAAFFRIPVVALDANIRNLVRLRRSAKVNKFGNLTLLWNFIGDSMGIEYLDFFANCNVGGAHSFKPADRSTDVKDTVPVMKIRASQLVEFIKTKNVAIKVDIQGGHASFMRHADRIFQTFSIKVVLMEMEYKGNYTSEADGNFINSFFVKHGFKPFKADDGKTSLKMDTWRTWYDVMWKK